MNKKDVRRSILPYLMMALIMLSIIYFLNVMNKKVNVLTYDKFMTQVAEGNIKKMELTPREGAQVYEVRGKLKGYADNEEFFSRLPLSEQVMKKLVEASEIQSFKFTTNFFIKIGRAHV